MSKIIDYIKYQCYCFLVDYFPHIIIQRMWKRKYGYKIDWKHPKDINEKIQWLICFGDTSRWSELADKYKVRKYVAEKGYSNLLPRLLGVWNNANDINFDELPQKCILKCNHDSGSYYKIDKSKGFDREDVILNLNKHLKEKFGYRNCEPHYNKIKSLIIAEEYLESPKDIFSSSLVDYKVWCFNGKPYSVWVCYNRDHNGTDVNLYDLDWNVHPEYSVFTNYYRDGRGLVPRPKVLPLMLKAASDLSEGFPEARIDFYIIEDKLYFGEITFTSSMGRMDFYTKDYLTELGKQVIIQ